MLISIISCKQDKSFTVKVNLKNIGDGTVYILGETIKDTLKMTNGYFEYKGNIESPEMISIHAVDNDKKVNGWFNPIKVFLDNSDITINSEMGKYEKLSSTITGGKTHNLYVSNTKKLSELDNIQSLYFKRSSFLMKGKFHKADSVYSEYNRLCESISDATNAITNWNNSVTSIFMILTKTAVLPVDKLKSITSKFNKKFADNPYYKRLTAKIAAKERMKIGNKIPNFTFYDLDGKEYSRDGLKGDYVLLDFGQYYCHWCVKEVPNVLKAYNNHKDKNFKLLSVSMNSTKKFWEKDSKRLEKYMHKYYKDLKHISVSPKFKEINNVVKDLTINGYPYIVLIDPEGKIVAKDLRGKYLQKVVDSCF